MAENEILDLGSPRRYRKWRSALRDPLCSPETVAGFLEKEFCAVVRSSLQRTPLHRILNACGEDLRTMRVALDACKNKDLARFAQQAYRYAGSKDVDVLANHIASGLIDRVVVQARLYASRPDAVVTPGRYLAVMKATEARLEACRSEIATLLAASLRDEKMPRRRIGGKRAQPSGVLSSQSLLVPPHNWGQKVGNYA